MPFDCEEQKARERERESKHVDAVRPFVASILCYVWCMLLFTYACKSSQVCGLCNRIATKLLMISISQGINVSTFIVAIEVCHRFFLYFNALLSTYKCHYNIRAYRYRYSCLPGNVSFATKLRLINSKQLNAF